MRSVLIVLVSFVLISISANSQDISVLEIALESNPSQRTEKLDALAKDSSYQWFEQIRTGMLTLREGDYERAFSELNQAKEDLSDNLLARNYCQLYCAICAYQLGEKQEAAQIYQDIREDYPLADSTIYFRSLQFESYLFENAGLLEIADRNCFRALNFFERMGKKFYISSVYADIATNSNDNGEYERARAYYIKSLKNLSGLGVIRSELRILNNYATLLKRMSQDEKDQDVSDSWQQKADSVDQKAIALNEAIKDSLQYLDLTYKNKILSNWNTGPIQTRINESNKLLQLAYRKNYYRKKHFMHWVLGLSFKELNIPDSVVYHFGAALNITAGRNEWSESAKFAGLLSKFYESQNQLDSSLFYAREQKELETNFLSGKKEIALQLLRAEFDTEQKEKTILAQQNDLLQQKADNKANQLEIEKQRRRIFYALFGLAIAIVIGVLFYRNQSLKRKALAQELELREEKEEQKIKELLQQLRFEKMEASIAAEERERGRLSQEIHDNVGSTLNGISRHLENSATASKDENLIQLSDRLKASYETLRLLSHHIATPAIAENALVDLTKTLLGNVMLDSDLVCRFIVFPEGKVFGLPQKTEINLYRIIQEAMNNVVRHANATEVEVQLVHSEEETVIIVEDNGDGFDMNGMAIGLGRSNMKGRAEAIGAQFKIDSRKGRGTIVTVELPKQI